MGGLTINESSIEYILPMDDLRNETEKRSAYFWSFIGIMIFSAVLCVVGIFVEYTKFGNSTLSHEETNFANIDIPIIH